jgi:hypothetical protein
MRERRGGDARDEMKNDILWTTINGIGVYNLILSAYTTYINVLLLAIARF